MTYRTKASTVEAYQFLRNPETDLETPYWLMSKVMDGTVRYSKTDKVLWIYPHRNIISLQQAHEGDYLVYHASSDEVWVEWRKEFESKYEPAS